MATPTEIKQFVEARLLAFDPSIDLSVDSPAQRSLVEPIVQRFSTDPFATDMLTFLRDVVSQAYPDLGVSSGGVTEDLFNAISLIVEPLRRSIQELRLGQSVRNAAVMTDDQADALAENYFAQRRPGSVVSGSVRVYFNAPSTQQITAENRCFTKDGRGYSPVGTFSISAEQMLFNRQNSLYFVDIVVEAENPGERYNVEAGEISGIDGIAAAKVANLSSIEGGSDREDNATLFSNLPNSLAERSLSSTRGITARVTDNFSDVRNVQVIGAGDPGMDRDVLRGTSEGFLHVAGAGVSFGDWLLMVGFLYRDDGDGTVGLEVGDVVRFHPSSTLGNPLGYEETEVVSAKILSLHPPENPKLLILDSRLTEGASTGRFAILKPGKISIGRVPGGLAAPSSVRDGEVHLGGHFDVFLRPTGDTGAQVSLRVSDEHPELIVVDFSVPAEGGQPSNILKSASVDFVSKGITTEHVVEVESDGAYQGAYAILEVGSPTSNELRVDRVFGAATAEGVTLRGRVTRRPTIDLVFPKIQKYPAVGTVASDLRMTVGSPVFRLDVDLQAYGVAANDVIEVLSEEGKGTYAITGFDPTLAGHGPLVTPQAPQSASGLRYRVYTPGDGISRPLVRVKQVELLDASGQASGIRVPYGLPIDGRAPVGLAGAMSAETIYDRSLVLLPDGKDAVSARNLGDLADDTIGNDPGSKEDARYSLKLVPYDEGEDIVRTNEVDGANAITKYEYLLPSYLWSGRQDKILALTTRPDPRFSVAPENARTSVFAELRPGDSFRILEGPNQGDYLLRDLHVYDAWKKTGGGGHERVAVARIDPPLKTSPLRTAIDIVNYAADHGVSVSPITNTELLSMIEYATNWDHPDAFLQTLTERLHTALFGLGGGVGWISEAAVKSLLVSSSQVSYEAGRSSRGLLRLYFLEPVSVELYSGDDPTEFSSHRTARRLRVDPGLPPAQLLPESETPTPPTAWLRTLESPEENSRFLFARTGEVLLKSGIRPGDTLEFRRPINEFQWARKSMESSWLCCTRAGSPVVDLLLPGRGASPENVGNFLAPEEGQLFFIDSGPDAGGYRVVKVESTPTWTDVAPVVRLRLDRPLSHTTLPYPSADSRATGFSHGFQEGVPPQFVSKESLTLTGLGSTYFSVEVSTNGGSSWTPASHHFSASPPASVEDAAAALNISFAASPVTAYADADRLIVRAKDAGPNVWMRFKQTGPTAHTAGLAWDGVSASTKFRFTEDFTSLAKGKRGMVPGPGTKKVYYSNPGPSGLELEAGSYLTLYAAKGTEDDVLGTGDDRPYLGTFKVFERKEETSGDYKGMQYLLLDRTASFPSTDVSGLSLYFVTLSSPPVGAVPSTTGGGKAITTQYVRFRMYSEASEEAEVAAYPWDEYHPLLPTSEKQLELAASDPVFTENGYGHRAPCRVLRPGVLRCSSTTMQRNREGGMYYLDVPVVGYGPAPEMNVTPDESFEVTGRYRIDGYALSVKDDTLTYSDQEEVSLHLPARILPAGSAVGAGKEVGLAGKTVRIDYDWAPTVNLVQSFLSSNFERPLAANVLCRHFFPAYVYLEASYRGGSGTDVVAEDLVDLIREIPTQSNSLSLDEVAARIRRRQATDVRQPLFLAAVVHGADRKVVTLRARDVLGGTGRAPFKGSFAQMVFIPGQDASTSSPRPDGEQIFLRKV